MERINFTHEDRSYAVREELKTLRTNIQFCGDDKRVILVTSCLAGEGKSTTTQELAETLSEIGAGTTGVEHVGQSGHFPILRLGQFLFLVEQMTKSKSGNTRNRCCGRKKAETDTPSKGEMSG